MNTLVPFPVEELPEQEIKEALGEDYFDFPEELQEMIEEEETYQVDNDSRVVRDLQGHILLHF